jgi:hypothetical protein
MPFTFRPIKDDNMECPKTISNPFQRQIPFYPVDMKWKAGKFQMGRLLKLCFAGMPTPSQLYIRVQKAESVMSATSFISSLNCLHHRCRAGTHPGASASGRRRGGIHDAGQ